MDYLAIECFSYTVSVSSIEQSHLLEQNLHSQQLLSHWENLSLQAIMHQQEQIVHSIGVFEEVKSLSEKSWTAMRGRQIGFCREDLVESAEISNSAHKWERESLITEMRENLSQLAACKRYISHSNIKKYLLQTTYIFHCVPLCNLQFTN